MTTKTDARLDARGEPPQKAKSGKDYWTPRYPIIDNLNVCRVSPLYSQRGDQGEFEAAQQNSPQPLFKQKRGERHSQASQAGKVGPDLKQEMGDKPKEGIMKKLFELFCPKRHREKYPGLLKGGWGRFRKMLNIVMLAALLSTASILAKPVYAGTGSEAYIVLTCTVTLSVSLTGSTTWFNLGNVSAGTTVYSTNGVTIRNNSQGAICTWGLNIDPNSLNGWTVANSPGLNQVTIYGVFQSTQNTANYSTIFSTTAQTYNASFGVFSCGSYSSPQAGFLVESVIPPSSMNGIGTYSSDRNLWIKLLTPLAVTDQTTRSIGIVITAAMAG